MPATIQVILQHDVDKLGKSGELVRVRPGFARNYLLPRQLAAMATSAAVHRVAHEKTVALARAEKAKKDARAVAGTLSTIAVTITQKAGEDGRLFGSVTSKDIEKAVRAQGIAVDRKKFQLAEPIKTVGKFEIPVRLASDVTATIKLEVVGR